MRQIQHIIKEIESFEGDDGNWLELEDLLSELWESGNPELGILSLFQILERYPTEDGSGVFWSILHGLETLECEKELYQSLMRKPSHMTIVMLIRIENSGLKSINGKSISELKNSIRNNPNIEAELIEQL